MVVCVECGDKVPYLVLTYGPAHSNTIALYKCQSCSLFADKYLEYNNVIIFIDALLHKPQAYRHLLFNRWTNNQNIQSKQNKLLKFSVVLLTVDVFVKWFKKDQMEGGENVIEKFSYYFCICLAEFMFNILIPYLLRLFFIKDGEGNGKRSRMIPQRNRREWKKDVDSAVELIQPNQPICNDYDCVLYNIISAIVISSFPRLFFVLMVIWDYQELKYSWIVRLFVFTSNVVALGVCLRKGVFYCGALLAIAFLINIMFVEIIESFKFY